MAKRDRESRVHKQELINRMVTKENLDRPGSNLTKADMSRSLIDDRVETFSKEKNEDAFMKDLRSKQGG